MSDYLGAHKGICAIAAEVGTITWDDDGETPPTFPAIPSNPTLIGYMPTLPEASPNLNNRKGRGIGAAGALYNIPGSPRPKARIELRPGSTGFITDYCQRDANDELAYFALFVGAGGVFTDVYRFCKVNDLQIALSEPGEGGGGEVVATINVFGIERQYLETPLALAPSTLRALGVPLMWHDLRGLDIPVSGTVTPFRRSIMGVTATINHNLEYKGGSENHGDNNVGSRCCYEIIEHDIEASAQLSFHKRLSRALFNGAVAAQQWGDIDIAINDVAKTVALNMTLEDAIVTNETLRGVASGEQMSHDVPVELNNIVFDDTPPSSE